MLGMWGRWAAIALLLGGCQVAAAGGGGPGAAGAQVGGYFVIPFGGSGR